MVSLRSVECRETLCRAELVCDSGRETAAFVERALRSADSIWDGAAQVLKTGETADGKWTVTAFFSKDAVGPW
jgi:hypothetical protein